MKHERGLSSKTIQNRCWHVKTFLSWYQKHGNSFYSIQVTDVYRFLTTRGTQWSRVSVATAVKALRAFFKYASMRGWCNSSIAETIEGPRIFSQEALPSGPSWDDVKLLIYSMNTDHPRDIRDRAIIMFFAIYGLRSSEVSTLRLEDIHWEDNKIIVSRGKQRRSQIYPLFPTVGNAVIHYLKAVRPQCSHREVFLTLKAPIKPLSLGALYHATRTRFENLKIQTLHRGPHALRHACATHLVAKGLSLKEIGDHLGHQSTCATRIYAKVDLPNLREVAAFNFGGVL